MDINKARPSERIRFQQDVIRQQDELIDLLKGALAAAGLHMKAKPETWLSELTSQERALVGALLPVIRALLTATISWILFLDTAILKTGRFKF